MIEELENVSFSEFEKSNNGYIYTFWNGFTWYFNLYSDLDFTKYIEKEMDIRIKNIEDWMPIVTGYKLS